MVTRTASGIERTTYREVADQARRIATVLDDLGVSADGRVGTFGWNTARHLALYLAIPSSGRVMHTINIRYFADQLVYTIDHAEDEVVFVDKSLLPLLAQHLDKIDTVQHIIVMDDGADSEIPDDPRIKDFAELVDAAAPADLTDRVTDERQGAAICYTTGTTGNPKGVFYSHRSMWLHSNACLTTSRVRAGRVRPAAAGRPDVPRERVGAAVRLLPGRRVARHARTRPVTEGPARPARGERVTVTAGVPTIWMGMLPMLERPRPVRTARDHLRRLGRAEVVVRGVAQGDRPADHAGLGHDRDLADRDRRRSCAPSSPTCPRTPRPTSAPQSASARPGVEVRIVDSDTREELPWDDKASGEVEARGPWVATQYYRTDEPGEQFSPDGWLRTGDVATIPNSATCAWSTAPRTSSSPAASGSARSTSRTRSWGTRRSPRRRSSPCTIRSGSERPLACVVVKDGEELEKEELLDYLRREAVKWQVPDDVVFIDEVPKTSVGKFSKKTLRDRFADYQLPTA